MKNSCGAHALQILAGQGSPHTPHSPSSVSHRQHGASHSAAPATKAKHTCGKGACGANASHKPGQQGQARGAATSPGRTRSPGKAEGHRHGQRSGSQEEIQFWQATADSLEASCTGAPRTVLEHRLQLALCRPSSSSHWSWRAALGPGQHLKDSVECLMLGQAPTHVIADASMLRWSSMPMSKQLQYPARYALCF